MSTTRAVTALAALIHDSRMRRETDYGVALDVDRAGMLMSPEAAAELDSLRKQVVSRDEHTAYLAECLVARTGELATAQAQVAELEAQRERRRVRLVALQNDASNMRGSLSPNGEARKVPFELGETLTPAVDWLIDRVAELETVRDDVLTLHVKYVDSGHCQHDGELWPCPTAEAVGGAA